MRQHLNKIVTDATADSFEAEARETRRNFLRATAAGSLTVLAAAQWSRAIADEAEAQKKKIPLGLDNFAVRAMEWQAEQLIDYAASLKLDSLLISDLTAVGSLKEEHLASVRKRAADAGLTLHLGSWSICPTSPTFKKDWGSAEEHLRLGLRVAKALGSPVFRVVLGSFEDRKTPGGIAARMKDTVAVCKLVRAQAMDSGVKIAVENHAGDMQSNELVQLIEEAGKEYVGANMDSGNAVWALEDPLSNLETLGPYVLTTSLRDSAVWSSDLGYTVQWTAMGAGQVDWKKYFARFAELCPGVPVHIETISGFNREIPLFDADFMSLWPSAKASHLAGVWELSKSGKPRGTFEPDPKLDRKKAEQEYQRGDFEQSIRFCKEQLGLGLR